MLHENTLRHIFNEGVYILDKEAASTVSLDGDQIQISGNKQAETICVLLSQKAEGEKELELLENILSAIHITKNDYCLTNRWTNELTGLYKYIFIFAEKSQNEISHLPLNKFQKEESEIFRTFGLKELQNNLDLKKELWQAISSFKK